MYLFIFNNFKLISSADSVLKETKTLSFYLATSARDHQVIRNPGQVAENAKAARNQWGRPGSTVVRALDQLPVMEGTTVLDGDSSRELFILLIWILFG